MRRLLVLSILLLAASLPARAEPAPSAPVRRHMEAYLAATNTEGEAAADAFRNDHAAKALVESVPRGPFVRFFTNQNRVVGGFDLLDLRMTGPHTAQALLRDRIFAAPHGLTLTLDDTPEARVLDFAPGPAPLWAPKPVARLEAAEVRARVAAQIERGCAAQVFSGAVLVAQGDEIVAQAACGLASRRYGAPNKLTTKLNLGSMNKMFTAVAVMQLVEAGKVSLDDPLSKYADDTWLPPVISRRVTVRQLMTHTSGLGDFLGPKFEASSRRLYSEVSDYKPLVAGSTLAFEPGTDFSYSNTGMLMLGVVIEKASGETYLDYVRGHIFQPTGMADTDSWPMDAPVPDLAMGYGWAPTTPLGWRENTMAHVFRGGPAGGGYSTVGDLLKFARALRAGKLVSPASRAFLWTDHPPHSYGAGFTVNSSALGPIVGHDGIFPGVSSQLEIYLDRDYVVAILGNQDYAARGLGDAIRDVLGQAKP